MSVLDRAVVRVISTLVPLIDSAVVVSVVVPTFTVILVRSTPPMASLKTRMICEPSSVVLGALSPLVTSVGFTPSTLWLAEASTAAWVRTASFVASAVDLIVPPLASSLLASIERPSVSSSLAATVYPENTSAAPGLPEL